MFSRSNKVTQEANIWVHMILLNLSGVTREKRGGQPKGKHFSLFPKHLPLGIQHG
jgi:hypothetical protein